MKLFSLLFFLLPLNVFSMNEPKNSENIDVDINILATEIKTMFLSHASLKDIYSFCRSSKANFEIFNDDRFWSLLSKRDFPEEHAMLEQEPEDGWKKFYKSCWKKSIEPVAPKVHTHVVEYLPYPSFSFGSSGPQNPSLNAPPLTTGLGFAW